jgi:hypothetical protein
LTHHARTCATVVRTCTAPQYYALCPCTAPRHRRDVLGVLLCDRHARKKSRDIRRATVLTTRDAQRTGGESDGAVGVQRAAGGGARSMMPRCGAAQSRSARSNQGPKRLRALRGQHSRAGRSYPPLTPRARTFFRLILSAPTNPTPGRRVRGALVAQIPRGPTLSSIFFDFSEGSLVI